MVEGSYRDCNTHPPNKKANVDEPDRDRETGTLISEFVPHNRTMFIGKQVHKFPVMRMEAWQFIIWLQEREDKNFEDSALGKPVFFKSPSDEIQTLVRYNILEELSGQIAGKQWYLYKFCQKLPQHKEHLAPASKTPDHYRPTLKWVSENYPGIEDDPAKTEIKCEQDTIEIKGAKGKTVRLRKKNVAHKTHHVQYGDIMSLSELEEQELSAAFNKIRDLPVSVRQKLMGQIKKSVLEWDGLIREAPEPYRDRPAHEGMIEFLRRVYIEPGHIRDGNMSIQHIEALDLDLGRRIRNYKSQSKNWPEDIVLPTKAREVVALSDSAPKPNDF